MFGLERIAFRVARLHPWATDSRTYTYGTWLNLSANCLERGKTPLRKYRQEVGWTSAV